jgi:hypothetical protein
LGSAAPFIVFVEDGMKNEEKEEGKKEGEEEDEMSG